jgi:hypothetical protein
MIDDNVVERRNSVKQERGQQSHRPRRTTRIVTDRQLLTETDRQTESLCVFFFGRPARFESGIDQKKLFLLSRKFSNFQKLELETKPNFARRANSFQID